MEGYDSKPNKNNVQRKEIRAHVEGNNWCVKRNWRNLYKYNEKKINSRKEVNSWIKIENKKFKMTKLAAV